MTEFSYFVIVKLNKLEAGSVELLAQDPST